MRIALFSLGLCFLVVGGTSCIVVVSTSCTDGLQNGDETDIDCGGATCAPCGDNRGCRVPQDCLSLACTSGRCGARVVAPSCSNGVRDGNETDIDCGGSCAACADGRGCALAADCTSKVCSAALRCSPPTCNDGVQNGSETGIDCGGSCPRCIHFPMGAGGTPMTGDVYQIKPNMGASAAANGGYILSANNAGGNVFRLTATGTGGTYQEFYGSIFSAGTITAVATGCGGQCSLLAGDFVSMPYAVPGGTRVDFDVIAPTNLAGFDLNVTTNTQATPVYFDLLIDGQRLPLQVTFVSSVNGQPRTAVSMPFALNIQ